MKPFHQLILRRFDLERKREYDHLIHSINTLASIELLILGNKKSPVKKVRLIRIKLREYKKKVGRSIEF
jgi:hypothetical protein